MGRVNNLSRAAAIAISAWLGGTICTQAADMPLKAPPIQPVAQSAWTFTFTPYMWMPSVSGDVTVKGRTSTVDVSFLSLLEHSEIPTELWGLMGTAEARKDKLSIFTDFAYMHIGFSASIARTKSVRPEVGGTLAASLGASFDEAILEAAAAYEIARWGSVSGIPGSGTALDVYAGARGWWQKAEADLAVAAGVTIGDLAVSGGRAVASSGGVDWVDPLVGMRLRHQLAPGKDLTLSGDIGGFGAGSKFSWQAIAALNWELMRTQSAIWSAMIGYRALSVDYSQGAGVNLYEFNVVQYGPIMGLTAKF